MEISCEKRLIIEIPNCSSNHPKAMAETFSVHNEKKVFSSNLYPVKCILKFIKCTPKLAEKLKLEFKIALKKY